MLNYPQAHIIDSEYALIVAYFKESYEQGRRSRVCCSKEKRRTNDGNY